MNDLWKTIRLGACLFALPLVATAAASAHQWMSDSTPVALDAPASVASETPSTLAAILRKHTIKMNRNGSVQGRVTAIQPDSRQSTGLSDLKIFFVQNGEIVAQSKTSEAGEFLVEGMAEGAYSFVATGENGFAAYGVQVVANSGTDEPNTIEASAVSPKFSVIQEILDNRVPEQITEEVQQLVADGKVAPNDVVNASRIMLDNGQLKGNVIPIWGQRQDVTGTYVHIIKDDVKVAEAQVDEKGHFTIDNMEPGVYDFVAAGPSGFAAVSFRAVQEEESLLEDVADFADEVADEAIDTDEVPVAIPDDAGMIPDSASLPVDSIVDDGNFGIVDDAAIVPDAGFADASYVDAGFADAQMFDGGFASPSLDVCTTCPQDGYVVDNSLQYGGEVYSEPTYSSPIEYAGECASCGTCAGSSCGSSGNFSNISSCNSCNSCCGGRRGLLGGGLAGGGVLGGPLGKLALLGGIAGAIIAIADDDDTGTPPVASPTDPSGGGGVL